MITTVQQHIVQEQEAVSPSSRGTFSWLLSGITLATKMIQARIRQAGLLDAIGSAGETNVQGEVQQKLDVYANQALLHCLGVRDAVAILVSEENEQPVTFDRAPETGKYVVIFDPLDGSSNIDVNVNVGTIFSIFRRPENAKINLHDAVLQPGSKQVAAGYVVYGSSTVFVYTAGRGVFGFTLDPNVGAFVLSHENMPHAGSGQILFGERSQRAKFPFGIPGLSRSVAEWWPGREYSSRYIGSLVADFHRTLLKGGVFLYPPTESHPQGKLRLLYEANPLAFIAEQAGGAATDGNRRRIMDIQPAGIHQRTSLVIGSRVEMKAFDRCCSASPARATEEVIRNT